MSIATGNYFPMTQLTKHLSCRVDARTHKAFQRKIKPLESSAVLRELISAVIDGRVTVTLEKEICHVTRTDRK